MAHAGHYQHKLTDIQDALGKDGSSDAAQLLNQLHQLLEDLNREMVTLRAQYHTRISSANAGTGSSRVLTSHRQSASGGKRAEQVAKLEAERDSKLAPYQEIKTKVEETLAQIAGSQPAA